MNRLFIIIATILLLITGRTSGQVIIEDGILDLRYSGIPERPVELRGDWHFFWNNHLTPSDISSGDSLPEFKKVHVPSYWTDYSDQIPDIFRKGYGTYRLRILIPHSYNGELAFCLPVFDSSYRMYLNEKQISTNGIAGTSFETSRPGYKPVSYTFIPQKDTLDILINVTNFHHRRGGFWLPIKLGESETILREQKQKETFDSQAMGMLLAFVGFYFLFYLMFRSDKSMLYFSLASFSMLVRALFTGTFHILIFFDISWHWVIRIEYLSSFTALIFGMWYFYHIYKDSYMPWINTAISALLGLGILLVLLTPVGIFGYSIIVFLPLCMLIIGYYFIRSIIAAIREKGYNIAIAVGFAAVSLGVLNDAFRSTSFKLISGEYILTHTLVFFMMMQVTALLYKWVLSTRKEKRLLGEIEFVNKNLENIVIERTSELSNQKAELENQKKVTDLKNRELEKTISVKNRIFSIIAHDLKSPVLNLSLMIDHLKDNNDPEVQSSLINSISLQSGFATNLIDNLLLWGEGQRNKIAYNPDIINLTDIVLENFNLLRESSDRKHISMTYSHKGNPTAIADKDLINIILRNIISNSIKFTPINGSISVSVEEPIIYDGMVYIRVKDNGVGIPMDKVDKIFGEEIIDSTLGTDNEKGTGLGLQLCNDLVRINKGSISIQSEENKGTTITIMIPVSSKKK